MLVVLSSPSKVPREEWTSAEIDVVEKGILKDWQPDVIAKVLSPNKTKEQVETYLANKEKIIVKSPSPAGTPSSVKELEPRTLSDAASDTTTPPVSNIGGGKSSTTTTITMNKDTTTSDNGASSSSSTTTTLTGGAIVKPPAVKSKPSVAGGGAAASSSTKAAVASISGAAPLPDHHNVVAEYFTTPAVVGSSADKVTGTPSSSSVGGRRGGGGGGGGGRGRKPATSAMNTVPKINLNVKSLLQQGRASNPRASSSTGTDKGRTTDDTSSGKSKYYLTSFGRKTGPVVPDNKETAASSKNKNNNSNNNK
jgi:hypothetical protein